MKIKKEVKFDTKKATSIFTEESKFIESVFSRTGLSIHNSQNEEDDYTYTRNKPPISNTSQNCQVKSFVELQARLEKFKGAKGLDYKDKMSKRKLKRQLKKQVKKEEVKMKKILVRTERNAARGGAKAELSEIQRSSKVKPIYNSEGHMVFNKFDFKELGNKKKVQKEKDPKKILEKLQENKKKIKELEQAGEKEKAEEIRDKEAWNSVLAKANGEKVKDDPFLLKKKIKREEKKKQSSAKKWQARSENVQKDMQQRQQKREENIAKRKKDKKMNKLKKATKKGRVIPGF